MENFWHVRDKFNQTHFQKVPLEGVESLEKKIVLARKAFQRHKNTSAEVRSHWLKKMHEGLFNRKSEMVDIIVKEAGKPVSYALSEVERSLTTLWWASEEILRFGGECIPMDYGVGKGKTAFTKKFPRGPVFGIAPFNFPLNLAMHKIAPAVATGNAIIVKPSPFTPLSLRLLHEIANNAGLPEGIFQVVFCDNQGSEFLVEHDSINHLSFTGSPKVGWMLKSKAGKKKVSLELGGNAGVLVDDTVDLEKTAKVLATGAYLYSGQICISTQRIYAHKEIKIKLQELLLEELSKLKCGDPAHEETILGPLIDSHACERVLMWVKEAQEKGATLLSGGDYFSQEHNILYPILMTNTSPQMKISCQEVFGPAAIIETVNSFEEGLTLINESAFGLQAGVFTEKISRAKLAIESLDVGGIMINNVPGFRIDSMPYGGVKDSGLGREGLKYSFEEMTESKLVVF